MASSSSAGEEARPTRIMIGVNESSIRGYPHPSISSRTAFDWTLQKIVRSNAAGFKLLFLHVQIPDEDATNIRSMGMTKEMHSKRGYETLVKQPREFV